MSQPEKSLQTGIAHSLYEKGKSWMEWLTPALKDSQFEKKGVLTPDEFVIAGDLLVSKCPTWSWASGDPTVAPYLPKKKHYLVIRNVPCRSRAQASAEDEMDAEGIEDNADGGWTLANSAAAAVAGPTVELLDDIDSPSPAPVTVDLDDLSSSAPAAAASAVDPGAAPPVEATASDSGFRMYDITITYDKFYATPRMWLSGSAANGRPLTEKEVAQDIFATYSGETVSLLRHPFIGTSQVSIHPCKHAETMLRFVERIVTAAKKRQEAAGTAAEPIAVRSDLYVASLLSGSL